MGPRAGITAHQGRSVPVTRLRRSSSKSWPLLALVFLASCHPAVDHPADRARTLVVAIDADPGHLNPAITTSGATHTASELLYNGLVELGPDDLVPVPELATSWEVHDQGRRYTFHLRDDVRWHDGEPFTAADVVYTFEEVLLQYHARTRASLGAASPDIVALDEHTVEFRFSAPYAPLLQQLNVTEAPILPRHLYEGTDPLENPANVRPVGTGPFRFVSSRPDEELRYAHRDRPVSHRAGRLELREHALRGMRLGYVGRRVLQVVPAVLTILMVGFALVHIPPGDPVLALAGISSGETSSR